MATKEKPEKNTGMTIAQSAIMAETVKKELANQKLYTNYTINPYRRMDYLAQKPNVAATDDQIDEHFLEVIKRAHLEPTKKYTSPQTESHEIGWITQPLIDLDRSDRRLYFPKSSTEITRFMGEFMKSKENSKAAAKKQAE